MDNINFKQLFDLNEIHNIIKKYNSYFPRSIESRVGDLYNYADKLLKNAFVWIAESGNNVVGLIVLYANDEENLVAYLSQIVVEKKFRNKGVGNRMIEFCKECAKRNKMKKLMLEVDNNNVEAIDFYYKAGFRQVSINATSQFMEIQI